MTPEWSATTLEEFEHLINRLNQYWLTPPAQQLVNLFLDSSPECQIRQRLPAKDGMTLADLFRFAPMAAIDTLLSFAQDRDLTELRKVEVLLAFATTHAQAVWRIIEKRRMLYHFLVAPKTEGEKATLLFAHTANPVRVTAVQGQKIEASFESGEKKIRLHDLFLPSGVEVENGDWAVIHGGWLIARIDEDLAREILIAQKGVKLGDKLLSQIYSQFPNEIDFETIFGGLFSGRHR